VKGMGTHCLPRKQKRKRKGADDKIKNSTDQTQIVGKSPRIELISARRRRYWKGTSGGIEEGQIEKGPTGGNHEEGRPKR